MALSPVDRRIWALAVPALGALLVEPIYNLTDTGIVGHLGRIPLGGLAVATVILNLVVAGCGFLSMAIAPRVAFLRGAGDPENGAAAAGAAYWAAVVLGVVLGALMVLLAAPLATVAGAHGAIHHQAVRYVQVGAMGVPFVLCILAGNGHLRGLADTKTPLFITLGSNALNVVSELAFVYWLHMGLVGSALGTVLAQVAGAAAFLTVSYGRNRAAWWRRRPDPVELRNLRAAGGVLIVRTLVLIAAWSGSTAVAARLGTAPLGGHQIALQTWFVFALSLDALAVPAQVLVGEAVGAGGADDAHGVARTVLRAGFLAGLGLGAIMLALAPVLPRIFTGDHTIRHHATVALMVGAASLPAAAVAFEFDGILLGSSDLRYLRRTMIVALVAFCPFAAATLAHHRLGVAGVWSAVFCWMTVRAAMLYGRWRSGHWLDGTNLRAGAHVP